MAKSKTKHDEKVYERMCATDKYFQSAALNTRTYEMYRQWLTAMAVNRFRWVNLPPTVSERYLEYTLFYNGNASLSTFIKNGADTGMAIALQANTMSYPNPQDDYDHWMSLGQDGTTCDNDITNGVLIWDNRLRMPIANVIDLFARRLTNIDRTLDINMFQQRTPVIITGPQGKELDVANACKSMAGGEPYMVGYDSLVDLLHIEAVSLGIPVITQDINTAWTMIWNNAMRFLGMEAINEKAERLVTVEAETQQNPSNLMRLDPLTARREGAEAYNRLFANTLVKQYGPLSVVWREDYESDTFNYMNNIEERSESDS